MPTQIQLRRGTYTQHQSFTGAVAEPTFDTTNLVMRIHDGTSPTGMEMVMGNSIYKGTPVKVVATSNITLYGVQTIDGVSLVAGDRVLVTSQTSAYQNGIYTVSSTAWSRAFDHDKIYNMNQHQFIYVAGGSNNAQTIWRQTSAAPTTIGVDSITFELWMSVESRGLAQNTVSGLITRTAKGTYTGRAITVSGQGISVTNGDGISGNPLLSLNSTPNNTASTIMARDATGSFVAQNAVLNGNLTVNGIVIDGGSLVSSSTTFNLVSTNATTVNIGDAATTVNIGKSGGGGTLRIKNDNVVLDGNLTINGTTTTTNSTTVTIDDPIFTLGGDTAPTSDDAKDRGIEFRYFSGSAKLGFMGWDNSQGKFWLLRDAANTGEVYSGTLADLQLGDLAVDGGDITTTQTSFNLLNATATTVNAFGAATAINIGASTGTVTISNPTIVGTQTAQNLWNTVATTVNAFGGASTLNIGNSVTSAQTINLGSGATVSGNTKTINLGTGGAAGSTTNLNIGSVGGGTLTINNPAVSFNNGIVNFTNTTDATTSADGSVRFAGGISVVKNIVCDGTFSIFGDISVNGGDILTNQTNVTVFNTTATTANLLGAASTINIGANSGILTIGNPTVVGTQTTQNLFNTVATTLNIGGAATTLTLGNATAATATIRPGTVVGVNTTQSLYDTVATTVNAFGAATTLTLGNATAATATIRPGTVVGSNATQNLWNTVATTVNFAGAATALNIGAATGTTTVNNNLSVTGTSSHTGNATFSGTVGITGATTLSSTLGVAGDLSINTNKFNVTAASGNTAIAGTLGVTGATTLSSTLAVTGASTFTGATTHNGGLTAASSSITGNETVGGTLSVTGAATLSSTLGVTGAATIGGNVAVNGGSLTTTQTTFNLVNTTATTLNIGGAATTVSIGAATGNTTVNNNLVIAGNLTVSGTTTTINATTLDVADLNITVAKNAATAAAANGAGLTVAGANATILYASTGDRWELNKPLYVAGTGAITGNTTVGGTLGVTGATTLSSTLAVTGSATFSTNLVLNGSTSGSTTIVSAATASGTLTLPSATDQLVARATTDTLTNKTMSGASNTFTNIPNSALSNNTISGVALGGTLATLTLNTSGTGLSGSTTYNGSGAATFTVTSNATSANTASTIVARDASGNFSAGTITAALSGNSSTATTLQTARNITINLGSNSAASFNGSSDITPGVTGTLAIGNGGTGATTAQGARTNLLPAQSAGQAGYVLTTNGTDVSWSYLGNAMVTTFNGRANAVTLTSGDVTTALGYSPSTYYAKYLQGADAYTNGSDGWWRSNGNCGWYNASYAVGWYATQSGWVQTYNSAGVLANAFQQVSDVRLKDNITDSKYGLDTVLKLRSVQYDMKSNGKHEVGLIAQEVEEVIPEFVFTSADEEGTKSVNYAQMVSVLIKAVQELSAEVEQLKAKIKE